MRNQTTLSLVILSCLGSSAQFAPPTNILTNTTVATIIAADFDGINGMDLVIKQGNSIGWVANDGTGQFGPLSELHNFGAGDGSFQAADMDVNGTQDLLINDTTQDLLILKNNLGGGLLGPTVSEDFENTGFGDYTRNNLIATNLYGGAELEAIRSNGLRLLSVRDMSLGISQMDTLGYVSPLNFWHALSVADMDGDGRKDIVSHQFGTMVHVQFNTGVGTELWMEVSWGSLAGLWGYLDPWKFLTYDIDQDGDPDILQLSDQIYWMHNDLDTEPIPAHPTTNTPLHSPYLFGDMVQLGCGPAGSVVIFHEDNTWTWRKFDTASQDFSAPVNITGLPIPTSPILFADINNDGNQDLIIQHGDTISWFANELPVESLPLDPIDLGVVCRTDPPFDLPVMGIGWTGIGVSAGQFDPQGPTNTGENTIYYWDRDANGCLASGAGTVDLHVPGVIDTLFLGTFCNSAVPYTLPGNGTWSGPNVTDGAFQPFIGTHYLSFVPDDPQSCADTVRYRVEVIIQPTIPPSVDLNSCSSGMVQLDALPAGGVWDAPVMANGILDLDNVPRTFTTFTYTYTDTNAQTCSESLLVHFLPFATLPGGIPEGPFCEGDSVTFGIAHGPFSYSGVSNEDFFTVVSSQFGDAITFFPIYGGGDYVFMVNANGQQLCSVSVQDTFHVAQLPAVSVALETLCENGPGLILGEEGLPVGGTYFLGDTSNQVTSITPSDLDADSTYALIYHYTDAVTGCTGTDSAEFLVAPTPDVQINIDPICSNSEPVPLGPQGTPAGGHFYLNDTLVTITELDPTNLTEPDNRLIYTYTSEVGCTESYIVLIEVLDAPVVSLVMDAFCFNGPAMDLEGAGQPLGGEYYINEQITPVTILDSMNLSMPRDTLYYVYTDSVGCSTRASVDFAVDICTGIQEPTDVRTLRIYPNPTRGSVRLASNIRLASLSIFDATGKTVWRVNSVSPTMDLDLSSLAPGIYQVFLSGEGSTLRERLVVE